MRAVASQPSRQQHGAVFEELMQECKHSAPGARLSAKLRTTLERLSPEERHAIVSRQRGGCAPLFVAARRGNAELVEYLVHVCGAELEQRGAYEAPDDRSLHSVTPLWAAAVGGHVAVLRALADAGARLDAPSDSGSTPLRSACFMTHVDAVRLLLARGADPHAPNHSGGTCLINSVQSARLVALLLRRGARPDAADAMGKTVLHYAVQEHRADTARLLLRAGADPLLRSRAGDDALRTAALKGAAPLLALLAEHVAYPRAQLADAYELLGATQLDEFNDAGAALAAWRRATDLRRAGAAYERKLPERPPAPALRLAREWETLEQLEAVGADADAMRTQALLVALRVLGEGHRDAVARLMYRGAAYADAFRYRRCLELWTWALEIRIERETVLSTDTCQTASALTRLLLEGAAGRLERGAAAASHGAVLRVFGPLAAALPAARELLRARPVCKAQAENFDRALRCATHLVYLLLETGAGAAAGERAAAERAVRRLLAADVRSAHTGDTPLHLAASRLCTVRSTYWAEGARGVFPHEGTARWLLALGADVRVRNEARSTPLHVAAIPYNFRAGLVRALLAAGAHLDQPNRFGDSPAELVALTRAHGVPLLQHVSLACLAARAALRHAPAAAQLPLLPPTLREFVELHRP